MPVKLHSPNKSKEKCPKSAMGQEWDRASGVGWGGHLGSHSNSASSAAPRLELMEKNELLQQFW